LLSAGVAAGLPHIVCYVDVEKHFYGTALARHGLGGHVAMASIDPKAFSASLRRIHADDALAARARAAAPGFLSRGHQPMESALPEAVAALL
jgi:UDP:flavonoid glycosyltransferase YjiC (YdhE family)